jgi:hypothetical protein
MHLQLKMTADEVMSCCYIFDTSATFAQCYEIVSEGALVFFCLLVLKKKLFKGINTVFPRIVSSLE